MKKILLELELTNFCNARCVMCPVVDMKRKKGFMTHRTFEININKGIEYGIERIRFCGLGEPLLHEDFCEFLSHVKAHNLHAELITNGSLLSKDIVRCLVQHNIDTLSISFPSLKKENFERIMKGLVFEKVFENVLFAVRELKKACSTHIRITSVMTGINHEEKEHIKHFWTGEGVDYIELHTAHNRGGHLKDMDILNLPFQPEETAETDNTKLLCAWPLRQFYIGWDGSVYLCCCDVEGEYKIGNIFLDDFGTMERTQESICIMQPDLCKQCSYQRAKVLS